MKGIEELNKGIAVTISGEGQFINDFIPYGLNL